MSKKKKFVKVRKTYKEWRKMRKCKDGDRVMLYFMSAWCTFNNDELIEFLSLCNKKDFKEMATYPLWM